MASELVGSRMRRSWRNVNRATARCIILLLGARYSVIRLWRTSLASSSTQRFNDLLSKWCVNNKTFNRGFTTMNLRRDMPQHVGRFAMKHAEYNAFLYGRE